MEQFTGFAEKIIKTTETIGPSTETMELHENKKQ